MNRVILTGRICKKLELKNLKDDKSVCEFTIATNRIGQEDADFINCVVWNKQAENLCKYQQKGNLIGVEGQLRNEKYEYNGQTKYKTYIIVSQLEFLSNNKNKEEKEQTNPYEEFGKEIDQRMMNEEKLFNDDIMEINEEDMPF